MKHSTVRLRRLSRELRTLRVAAGLTTEAAAEQIGWSKSKLNRFETGKGAPTPQDVASICHLYCVDQATTDTMVQLAREVTRRGWWTAYSDVLSGNYIEFEAEATVIRAWEPLVIPGLFQTEDYARAIIRAGHPDRPEVELARRVDARMQRKVTLVGPRLPMMHVLLAEEALRRPVGSPTLIGCQLDALLQIANLESITIQILPRGIGAHGGLEGAFSILSFAGGDPDLGYAECPAGEVYVEAADQVAGLMLMFGRLADACLSPNESVALISAVRSENDPL